MTFEAEQDGALPVPGTDVERRTGGSGTSGQAEAHNGAEGHPRDGWVYAIRTAPYGHVLYEAESPDAAVARARKEGTYFAEYDDIVGRPIVPGWNLVVAATVPTAEQSS